MLLNDKQIYELCMAGNPMIEPFCPGQVVKNDRGPVVSYGLSSVGYDIRLDRTIKRFVRSPYPNMDLRSLVRQNPQQLVIDVKDFDPRVLETVVVPDEEDFYLLAPREYILGNSMEHFHMPETVGATCLTKSTWARAGMLVNVTPLEPGWQGWLTLEIANLTDLPIKVYVGEGIAQLLFHKVESPMVPYNKRKGKYQDQEKAPVAPRMKR